MGSSQSKPSFNVTEKDIEDYVPDPHNANSGSERGNKLIKKSIEDHGVGRSLVSDNRGVIIAGNKTRENAIAAGITKVIEVETDGDAIIVHKRRDWDIEQSDEPRIYAYTDNRTSEVSLNWDAAQIYADQQEGLDFSDIFTAKEMREITASLQERPDDDAPNPQLENMEALFQKWQTNEGDLWIIKSIENPEITHRLVCGDSTSPEVAALAIGDTSPFIMVTDPPYGVNYDPAWREEYDKRKGKNRARNSIGTVVNDDRDSWEDAYKLFPGDVMYVWHGVLHIVEVSSNITNCGFSIRAQIIWMKQALVMSRGHYHWQHEPCFYAVRNGKKSNWHGDRKQSTVWQVANMGSAGKTSEEDSPHWTWHTKAA